jgi:tetratricopeptide (TPR) repeat protein
VEIWHDLAHVYISLSQWHDAEVCLSKSKAIKPYSASRCHALGKYIYMVFIFEHRNDANRLLSLEKNCQILFDRYCLSNLTGIMYEAKGLYNEALKAFGDALNIEPGHVLSLISTAVVLKRCSNESNPAVRSFLMDALRHDRLNASAWYNLGLYHKAEGTVSSLVEATECFQAAQSLEESTPLEPFR